MPNYCEFTVLVMADNEEQAESFMEHWESMLEDHESIKLLQFRQEYPEVSEEEGAPYYDRDYMGASRQGKLVTIEAISNWRPPLFLLSAMSQRWVGVEIVVRCCVEHARCEAWHCQDGDLAIIDLFTVDLRSECDSRRWYVRNGEVIEWPDWHELKWLDKVWSHQMPEWAVDTSREQLD